MAERIQIKCSVEIDITTCILSNATRKYLPTQADFKIDCVVCIWTLLDLRFIKII